jgi:hypothetical protein
MSSQFYSEWRAIGALACPADITPCPKSAPNGGHAVGAEVISIWLRDSNWQITHLFWLCWPGVRPIGVYVLAEPPCGVHKRSIAAPPMYP